MPDTSENPHQPSRIVATGCFAVGIYSGQVTHVRAGPLALWSALVNGRLVLEVGSMMAEQNTILNIRHGYPLRIKINVVRDKSQNVNYWSN